MCCARGVTSESADPFNALPVDWATNRELLASLSVDDDDEHDDPVLRYADGRTVDTWREDYPYDERLTRHEYEHRKRPLQIELVKLQNWVKETGQRIVIVFEGRDAAGKGGTIKRFTEHLNPRGSQVVALVKPTERERTQWYFQRYVPHLPAAGEIVMFDRSWYNRAGVERVMSFCTDEEYWEFMREAPEFERMLVRSGLDLTKFWFSVTPAEQRTRFIIRRIDPVRQWKLSPMDIESLDKWEDYTEAKEAMFHFTDTPHCPLDGGQEQRQEAGQARGDQEHPAEVRLRGQGRGADREAGQEPHRPALGALRTRHRPRLPGAMSMTFAEITSAGELRDLLGLPSGRAVTKERTRLHEVDREWLAVSPFCVIATSDADGNCDASPKGDPAGHLVHVLDDATVAVAERPGNKRADGYLNVLANPHVGIISLIPGRNETLRINGRARLLRDAPFFGDLAVRGQRPILVLLVDVEQIFFHCPKSFLRSRLWQPDSWRPDALPSHATLVKRVQETPETLEELEEYYAVANYSKRLY